jgi:hypothetical protein
MEPEEFLSMDLPFTLFLPFGGPGEDATSKVPPASLQLPSRTAETYYELVVTVQHSSHVFKKHPFPVLLSRYDTLSTFGMYNQIESAERWSDHIVTLSISLKKWSYGPLDPVNVTIKLAPNPDWVSRAKRVTIQKISIGIEECITYNHEDADATTKINKITRKTQVVGVRLPDNGYLLNMGLIFPSKDSRDADGAVPKPKEGFPNYAVSAFTTRAKLYKIEYFLVVKVNMSLCFDPYQTRC